MLGASLSGGAGQGALVYLSSVYPQKPERRPLVPQLQYFIMRRIHRSPLRTPGTRSFGHTLTSVWAPAQACVWDRAAGWRGLCRGDRRDLGFSHLPKATQETGPGPGAAPSSAPSPTPLPRGSVPFRSQLGGAAGVGTAGTRGCLFLSSSGRPGTLPPPGAPPRVGWGWWGAGALARLRDHVALLGLVLRQKGSRVPIAGSAPSVVLCGSGHLDVSLPAC